jgi:hypothetical protein
MITSVSTPDTLLALHSPLSLLVTKRVKSVIAGKCAGFGLQKRHSKRAGTRYQSPKMKVRSEPGMDTSAAVHARC